MNSTLHPLFVACRSVYRLIFQIFEGFSCDVLTRRVLWNEFQPALARLPVFKHKMMRLRNILAATFLKRWMVFLFTHTAYGRKSRVKLGPNWHSI